MRRYAELVVIAAAFLIAVKLRILNPWHEVFSWTVMLGGNDPWYYYRLVENCIHNFPARIWFDPFTQYPFGSYVHFGPFLVYLSSIAGIAAGASSGEKLRAVLVFLPAIGGILCLVPIYLLASRVFNSRIAAISLLLLSFLPGQFLQRSVLGFNDHHIWEVFWMLATLAAYTYAIEKFPDRKLAVLLPGVAYGMYLLTWAPSFAFSLVILAYVYVSLILKRWIDFRPDVALASAATVLIAATIYAPLAFNYPGLSTTHYSPLQLAVLIAVSAILAALYAIDRYYDWFRLPVSEPVLLVALAVIGLVALPFVFPPLYVALLSVIGVIQPKGGMLTVAEAHPFFISYSGQVTFANAYKFFGTVFFFSIAGYALAAYRILRGKKSVELLILIWAIAMFVALAGQNRFAYYFAAVAAVYAALVIDFVLEKLHVYRLHTGNFSYLRAVIGILIAVVAVYPTYALAEEQAHAGGMPRQWYEALEWMKANTPDGNYDSFYYQLYPIPEGNRKPYSYPFDTYGVMSWWDYGHWIEAVAHRIPIANPFQAGIGNKYNNVPGAAPFFTATNESYAESVAEKLNVRYVVSDIEMATGKFYAMAVWAEGDLPLAEKYYDGYMYVSASGIGFASSSWQIPLNSFVIPMRVPSEMYYETIEAKLHLFDASGLSHYRLIYESDPPGDWRYYSGNESEIIRTAISIAYGAAKQGLDLRYFPATQEVLLKFFCKAKGICDAKLEASGYVKVFERVRGAVIKGKANSKSVEAVVEVRTNKNRTFFYKAIAEVKNGTYELVLPYAQETAYPVKAVTPYEIRAGNVTKKVTLSDSDVESGRVIVLDMI